MPRDAPYLMPNEGSPDRNDCWSARKEYSSAGRKKKKPNQQLEGQFTKCTLWIAN